MSYARWSEESDVYVFGTAIGSGFVLECCACRINNSLDFHAATVTEMVAHLAEHTAAGHMVPEHTVPALIEDGWPAP